ncbi:MAG: tripartite tricarboxylate transporter family receptor [Hyphomicrobiales bacterium]|nr:tripartite tricarboxylate transporter family receptor [Hyphomicrobiales bacterium]
MPGMIRSCAAALIFAASTLAALPAWSADDEAVANFYRGRQVKVIISGAVGSDYDMYARLITRLMTRYLPGNPTFLPQNMPGAGHLTATNYLYSIAPQDGSVIGMVARNIPQVALLKEPNARFEPAKFQWLGNPEVSPQICATIAGVSVQKAEDLFKDDLLIGGAGAASSPSEVAHFLRGLLGMRFKLVEGYKSVPEVSLAMMRREVHAVCQSLYALQGGNLAGWIADGRLKVLFNFEKEPVPGLDAPSIYRFLKTDEQLSLMNFFTAAARLGRPMLAPPNVPAERVAALRKAFIEAVNDPELHEEVRRVGGQVTLVTGEEVQSIVEGIMNTPIEVAQRVQAMTRGQ